MPTNSRDPGKDAQTLRLAQRLDALRAPVDLAARGRRRLDARAPLEAMAREVDETVLPRCLMFENDRGECLGLDVASARILSVARLDLKDRPASLADLTGHAFFDAEDPKCALLHGAIEAFVQGLTRLEVRAIIVPEAQGFSNVGVTLRGLACHAAPPRPAPQAIGAFFEACRDLATAFVHVEAGQTVDSWGAPEAITALGALAAEGIAEPGRPDAPQRALAWAGQGTAYFALGFGAATALIAAPAVNFGAIVRLWFRPGFAP